MKKYLLLVFLACSLFSCEDEEIEEPASFTAVIDGERIYFQQPKVIIKKRNGGTYTQEIIGTVSSRDSVERVLTYMYSGDLDANPTIIMGIYYENDYKDSWSSMPMEIDITITDVSDEMASGSFSDFDAVGDNNDTVRVSGAKFVNLPIRVNNL